MEVADGGASDGGEGADGIFVGSDVDFERVAAVKSSGEGMFFRGTDEGGDFEVVVQVEHIVCEIRTCLQFVIYLLPVGVGANELWGGFGA